VSNFNSWLIDYASTQLRLNSDFPACKVCGGKTILFDVIDIERQCSLKSPYPDGLSGIPIYYHKCSKCNFIFTHFFDRFVDENWSEYIYNNDYKRIDPDYAGKRAFQNKNLVKAAIKSWWSSKDIGLDYGGGIGGLSDVLNLEGIKYESFDPFGGDTRNGIEKKYSIISAFEVLEHVTSPLHVFDAMVKMLDKKRGLLLISTQLTKATMNSGQLINSWYAAPRNGHISLYSIETMNYLADKFKLDYRRVSRGLHIFSYGLNAKDIGKKLFFSKVFSRLHSFLIK
jgi:hypothetical protein